MKKIIVSLLGFTLLYNSAVANEMPSIVLNDLNTKIYWYPQSVESIFLSISQQTTYAFQQCLGVQPWSVADILQCCIKNYNEIDNSTQCVSLVEYAIKSNNDSITKIYSIPSDNDNVTVKNEETSNDTSIASTKATSSDNDNVTVKDEETSNDTSIASTKATPSNNDNVTVKDEAASNDTNVASTKATSSNNNNVTITSNLSSNTVVFNFQCLDNAAYTVYGSNRSRLMLELYDMFEALASHNIIKNGSNEFSSVYRFGMQELEAFCSVAISYLNNNGYYDYSEEKCQKFTSQAAKSCTALQNSVH